MQFSSAQLEAYQEQGFLLARGLIVGDELARLKENVAPLLKGQDSQDGLHREHERSGAVRQVYLAHRYNDALRALCNDPRIVDPVRQVLGGDVYVWHSKLNVKDALEGTVWLWHQDYGYWYYDGVEPRLLSVMVMLDPSTLHNGCLMVVAGSHRWGRLDHEADTQTTSYRQWCIQSDVVKQRLREEMIVSITGEPGRGGAVSVPPP